MRKITLILGPEGIGKRLKALKMAEGCPAGYLLILDGSIRDSLLFREAHRDISFIIIHGVSSILRLREILDLCWNGILVQHPPKISFSINPEIVIESNISIASLEKDLPFSYRDLLNLTVLQKSPKYLPDSLDQHIIGR